ncbi:ABC transporter substrate-binding protein [Marivibrio halodurans]|uniref:ABC transporter substrate-binding protein n=2 Tax=Marivibrio halodurans TaxID=2039722 RepID=A0A8J7S523_9PROT|nr:ABC transporter substrate-binding protein [Marivibrio halodurans]
MPRVSGRSALAILAAPLAIGLFALSVASPASAQERVWPEILAAAEGESVYWNAWGGSESTNGYIQWVADTVEDRFGIDLVHVKLNDTAEAVRKVLAEKTAGRDEDGSVDLIWINGENFKAMKDANLLHGPLDEILPNFALIDPVEKPTTVIDFTVPTEGLEAPWGMAKIVFPYDSARLEETPGSIRELLAFAKANPGRFTYPAPPDFTGTTFLKQALHALADDPAVLLDPAGGNFAAVTAPLWAYLDELDPVLWREGTDYPKSSTEQMRMLDNGAVDIAISFNPGEASALIAQGRLPETVRTFVFDEGTIGNTHFVAIPYNAAHKDAAMVVANFLMGPEAQARKQDATVWGDQTVLSVAKLSAEQRALFADLPRGPATLPPNALGPSLPEPHPTWMTRIEEHWLTRYGS